MSPGRKKKFFFLSFWSESVSHFTSFLVNTTNPLFFQKKKGMEPSSGLFQGSLSATGDTLAFLSNVDYPRHQAADADSDVIETFAFGSSGAYGFEPNADGLEQFNDEREFDTSKHQVSTVNITIMADADREGAVWKYHEVPIFMMTPCATLTEDLSINRHRVVSLWHLNAMFRKKFMERASQKSNRLYNSRKRAPDNDLDGQFLPNTIAEFQKYIKFAGYKIANSEGDPDENPKRFYGHKTVVSAKLAGEINNVPNIWGNEVLKGQAVGFAVRWERIRDEVIRNWDGSEYCKNLPSDVDGFDCIQVVPVIAKQGRVPYGVTAKYRAESGKLLTQNINKHDGNTRELVFYDWGGGASKYFYREVPAHFIPVGTVIRRKGFPSDTDVQEAICTFSGYQKLASNYEDVDLEILPDGKRELWLCN